MATAMTVQRIPGYDVQEIRQAMTAARAQGKNQTEYGICLDVVGGAQDVVLRRKSGCRSCGEVMPKGATATQFAYRSDTHRYRITEMFIHPEQCVFPKPTPKVVWLPR